MKIGNRQLKRIPLPRIPKPQSRFGKVLKAILPLLLIALAVFVIYNFPALKRQLTYLIHKPKVGNPTDLPRDLRAKSSIPVKPATECGKPISFDDNGNPTAICDDYIYISKIRVGAPIVFPTETSDQVINDALLKGVVHYPGTATSGQKGNVFLTGHSSYYWWVQSDYKTVFTLTPQLSRGDSIAVYHKGIRYLYEVTETFDVQPTQTDVLAPTKDSVLTLSTCVPVGTALRRHITRAKQVSPDPATNSSAGTTGTTPARLPGVR